MFILDAYIYYDNLEGKNELCSKLQIRTCMEEQIGSRSKVGQIVVDVTLFVVFKLYDEYIMRNTRLE